jgi:ornithine decarboxylase
MTALATHVDGQRLALAARAADYPTPFLLMDPDAIGARIEQFQALLPDIDVHYAMKCNPDPQVVEHVRSAGGSFEIAGLAELRVLLRLGVAADEIIFSNPVKMATHIRAAFEAGVRWFAFDSADELAKLAQHAPGSSVYVRLRTPSLDSLVPSEGKFGVDPEPAVELMLQAAALGLVPAGIGFHVGSQMLDPAAWTSAIASSGELMRTLAGHGIVLDLLDLGGGFPARYADAAPDLAPFAAAITTALAEHLPYAVGKIAIEPGRALVAEAGVMVATIIGTATRGQTRWLHLDVGAFNGMMEALETQNALRFPVTDSGCSSRRARYNLTGPSCDSQDTILFDVELSDDLGCGDRLYLHTAGAYTTCYASNFNGFDIPRTYCL